VQKFTQPLKNLNNWCYYRKSLWHLYSRLSSYHIVLTYNEITHVSKAECGYCRHMPHFVTLVETIYKKSVTKNALS